MNYVVTVDGQQDQPVVKACAHFAGVPTETDPNQAVYVNMSQYQAAGQTTDPNQAFHLFNSGATA